MPKCQFPARKWFAVRRAIAQLADETEDIGVVLLCCRIVLDIERMRLKHTDTGCDCWMDAAHDELRPFSVHDAAWLLELKVKL